LLKSIFQLTIYAYPWIPTLFWKMVMLIKKRAEDGHSPVHTCNPRYLGDWDLEDCSSRLVKAKSLWHPISTEKSWAQWHVPIIPTPVGSGKYEDHYPAWPVQKVRPYLQNNQSNKWIVDMA
jgi:hypothetical protein